MIIQTKMFNLFLNEVFDEATVLIDSECRSLGS